MHVQNGKIERMLGVDMLITRDEAIKRKLNGWDVFKRSHLIYMDGINRDASAAILNYESYKAFFDTILLNEAQRIKAEQDRKDAFINAGKSIAVDAFPWPEKQQEFGHFRNYEYLKIGCGFELSLKSSLLFAGFVIHEIERSALYKDLANEQKERPVKISELIAISDYMFDGEKNILPGITEKSIPFSRMIEKPNYQSTYKLSSKDLGVITDYKDLRNAIHLPGEIIETSFLKTMSWSEKIDHLYSYIEEHLVAQNRALVGKHSFHQSLQINEWETDIKKWKV